MPEVIVKMLGTAAAARPVNSRRKKAIGDLARLCALFDHAASCGDLASCWKKLSP
jgi:hypothetical protein